jgi:DNA-binding beta-propeller fold protein YncE
MYIIGRTNDNVNEYDLSSAWDISTASYLQAFSVATEETVPEGLAFKPDGTKMYVVGSNGDDVNEYDLSTPWDISTASYLQNFSVAAQETNPGSVFFKPDGTKMYITGTAGDDVNEYDLSTPWDISTASYLQNFSLSGQDTAPFGLFFHPDGSGFYVVGINNDTVYQYTIGGFSVAAQEVFPLDLFFKPDGTKMYVVGNAGDDVNEYDLSSAWDITTASYLQNFSVAAQDTTPTGLFFKPDGTKMYVVGQVGTDVNEYTLSTAWDVSSASYTTVKSIAFLGNPKGIYISPDGLNLYAVYHTSGDAYLMRWIFSSAWNLSTLSGSTNIYLTLETPSLTAPEGVFFKPDGTKYYIVNDESFDSVYEYSLATPWDLTTRTYVTKFRVVRGGPTGLFWKDDGTQFWNIDAGGDKVFSYKISPT